MTDELGFADGERPVEAEPETVKVEGLEIPTGPPPMAESAQPQQQEMLQTECAFVVYLDPAGSGKWIANGEILGKPIAVGRGATLVDFTHAAADIAKDIMIHDTVEAMLFSQAQMASAMVKKQQDARVMAEVAAQMDADRAAAAGKGGVILKKS